jgi:hypothetical protein
MGVYGHLMKPVNNKEAVKLRATIFSSKKEANGSKMVAEDVRPAKKHPACELSA